MTEKRVQSPEGRMTRDGRLIKPFPDNGYGHVAHGARSEKRIAELMPETQEEVQEAQEEIARALAEIHGTGVPKADTLIGQRLARTMAQLRLYDRYEDQLAAQYAEKMAKGDQRALGKLLEHMSHHAEKKSRAEALFLKQLWASGLGEMAQARVKEATSAAEARNPQPRGAAAQQRALQIINGEVVRPSDD